MYFVYLTTDSKKNILYTGITNDITRRLCQHYDNRGNRKTFTGRYSCYNLLYYETHIDVFAVIAREKEIKGWTRKKKMELVKNINPDFVFLNCELFSKWPPS